MSQFIRHKEIGRLTPRQIEVISLVASGLSDKEIAEKLYIHVKSVGKRIYDARCIYGANNRTHLIAMCIRDGLIK